MADYYPLIARAIAGLDPNAPGESRRALYERARSALIAQLRSVQPPLSESEITRERLSLEEAVRKVESEAAQRAREARLAGGSPTAAPSTAPRPGDALRRASARTPDASAQPGLAPGSAPSNGPGNGQGAAPPLRQRPAAPPPARNERPPVAEDFPEPPPPPQRQSRSLPPQAPPPATSEPQSPPPRERSPVPRRGAEQAPPQTPAMRGFRDITADVDDLGRAAASANRAARKTYANVPPDTDRLEPGESGRDDEFDTPYSYDESIEEAERYAPPPQAPRPRLGTDREREVRKTVRRGGRFPFKTAIVLGVILILVGAGLLWGKQAVNTVTAMLKSSPVVEAPKDTTAPLTKPKIPDRVGQAPSSDQLAPVAQHVTLYDEDPSDPKGKQYSGTVVWRTEQIKASGGQKADIAVRADIEIPDRKFKMTMSFRRNTDTSLPASHTAELTFILPPDFSNGGVANVPGILMKSNEQARGVPLSGIAVKVTDGFFLIGLSNVDADRVRNIQLLKERSWFDVPLVYTKDQRRAIIAIEKGAPGDRAFNDAFAVWGD